MNKTCRTLGARLTSILLCICIPALAMADDMPKDAQQEADQALLQRLEQSGALDQAIERAFQRVARRQAEARQKAQADAQARRIEQARNARAVDPRRDHVFGDAKAPISIIEYSDFECPFCKRFQGIPEEVVKRLGGKANFVWRHLPLEFHGPLARRAAEAAECAARIGGNESFWTYTNEVLKRTESNGKGMPAGGGDPLLALAAELKLDAAAFGKCLDSGEMAQRVAEDVKDAEGAGINGTPGIVLRHAATGKVLLAEGAISPDALERGVRELLAAE